MMSALLVVGVGALLLAGAFAAMGGVFTGDGRSRRIVDQDEDGEPDETPGEKARARAAFEDEAAP